MTDMTITACAPLPGQGLVARRGDLVIVTDGQSDGPDPLLGALEQTAGGDGTALVLAAARALLTYPGQSSGACAGVTAGGAVAVLVHGSARVTVAVDSEPEVVLTADGSMLPVHRTFTGSEVRAWLLSGGPAVPDDRLQLDGGVIYAAGLALEVTSATGGTAGAPAGGQPSGQALAAPAGPALAAEPAAAASAELAPPAGQPAGEPAYADDDIVDAGSADDHQAAGRWADDHRAADHRGADHRGDDDRADVDIADAGIPAGDRAYGDRAYDDRADGDRADGDEAAADAASDDGAGAAAASEPPALAPDEQAAEPAPAAGNPLTATMNDLPVSPEAAGLAAPDAGGQPETVPPFDVPPQTPAGVSGPAEWWFTASQDVVSGQGDDWRPPTFIMPATGSASLGAKPKIHEPEGSDFEYVSFLEPGGQGAPGGEGDHNGHEVVVEADSPADNQAYGPVGSDLYMADPAMVDGVMCARNHFNDPSVQYCRQCGIAMVQQTARYQRGPRPPLGVLLLDDGTGFTLDKDYVVGREPVLDGDVAAGRARPMRIPDPGGTVSRLHLRISLIGWQVEVRDLNSANGSVLHLPNGSEQRLMPGDTQVIEPGTKIVIGHRNLQYQSYRAG